ncbi:MAG: DNA polymerase I [Candidatus Kerfeldbacteria bacterium RIFCSPLOWO2_01_FULL_48_11]|uniref:DNA polymerase I n=1 Tax=Candidatus Kerfeldbacteria bacterium RIFCSPLOWO2_01_FULL_48_11 TaxID=1798543 RepID=A0A1G2B2D2_9BACT|nr:MAG: polymerase I protein [Parcubacteria group bacterium GW2011_GWC2_49_9]OGY83342.1 MAG: DNA polymerase I [Candidatus Kerfeldbacteria bacterium RIFCSPLOWO2_01_FULL_48_11]
MAQKVKIFLIIDANAILHRSFHALPPLTSKDGIVVNAVYGFATTLLKAMKEFRPGYIAVAFDKKGPTFRHKEYAEYKATRVKAPQEFYDQIPIAHDLLDSFNIPIFELDGYEADDVIGTLAKKTEDKANVIIATGDMDALQLVDDNIRVFTLRKGVNDTVIYDAQAVKERYGFTPAQVIDYKALAGDSSDNIPGVKGVGEKTATELLKDFGDVETLYKELEKDSPKARKIKESVRTKLINDKKNAFMSKKLATIVCDAPVKFELENTAKKPFDERKVVTLFQKLGFKSLLERLPKAQMAMFEVPEKKKSEDQSPEAEQEVVYERITAHKKVEEFEIPKGTDAKYELVDTPGKFQAFLAKASKQTEMAVDTETTSLEPHSAKLLGVSFSWKDGEGYFIGMPIVSDKKIFAELQKLLENHAIKKIGHNIKYDYSVLKLAGIELAPIFFDTMVASYLTNAGTRQHSLDSIVFAEFGYRMVPIEALIGVGKKKISMEQVPQDKLSWYTCEDADFTWRMYGTLKKRLEKENLTGLFMSMELPLINVLAEMEMAGIEVDTGFLAILQKSTQKKLDKLTKSIYEHAGKEFNINSPLQLKEILFDELQISSDRIKRTKTGLSTAASELEKMKGEHPIIDDIVEYRELAKLQSTYIEALPKLVNEKTGRVHTSFNQAVAATGRLSSSDPNLQNIPIRSELGNEIRKAFVAGRGRRIVSADYSQIELRVVASLANDEKMIESFKKGEDIHKRTAADVYEVPIEEVTKEQRYAAKEVNFGVLYGMGVMGLASRKGITREHAREFIDKYFSVHHWIRDYIDSTKALAHNLGYVETLLGRRRYIPDINSGIQQVRAAAERMAVNMPVQGTAADLMKLAMITVQKGLPKVSPESKLLLQVHDELVLEVPQDDVSKVAKFITETMNSVYKLKVPVETEVSVGKNWGELEEYS